MSKRHRDEEGKKEYRTTLANASMTDLKKKDSHRRAKSSYGDIYDSPEVTAENQSAIHACDEGAKETKGENKHRPKGDVRTKRHHSSDEGSVSSSSSSSSSSSCSSHKRDKKRKRSSSSRKKRRKEEKRRQKASKKTKKKKRSKSRDFESSSDDGDEANVRRSAITGRRIKMHVDKDAGDLVLEKARKDFLRYVNSSL